MKGIAINIKELHEPVVPKQSTQDDVEQHSFVSEKLSLVRMDRNWLNYFLVRKAPFRLKNIRFGLLVRGEEHSKVNMETRQLVRGSMEFLGPDTLFQILDTTDDILSYELIIDPAYVNELCAREMPPMWQVKAKAQNIHITRVEEQRYIEMWQLLQFFARTEGEESPVTRALIISTLRYIQLLFSRYSEDDQRSISRQEQIFHEFARLVSESHGKARKHAYYASALNVSEHYLSLAVKHSSGITAKEWIDRSVMTEIKLLLVHTTLNISQIADKLDFPSDSFLCKFFRQHAGMSPKEFRKEFK